MAVIEALQAVDEHGAQGFHLVNDVAHAIVQAVEGHQADNGDDQSGCGGKQGFGHGAGDESGVLGGVVQHLEGVEHADDGAQQAQQGSEGDDGVEYPQALVQYWHLPHHRFLEDLRKASAVFDVRKTHRSLEDGAEGEGALLGDLRQGPSLQVGQIFDGQGRLVTQAHHAIEKQEALDADGQGNEQQDGHEIKNAAGHGGDVGNLGPVHGLTPFEKGGVPGGGHPSGFLEGGLQGGIDVGGQVELPVGVARTAGIALDIAAIEEIIEIQSGAHALEAQAPAQRCIAEGVAQAGIGVEAAAQGQKAAAQGIIGVANFVDADAAAEAAVTHDQTRRLGMMGRIGKGLAGRFEPGVEETEVGVGAENVIDDKIVLPTDALVDGGAGVGEDRLVDGTTGKDDSGGEDVVLEIHAEEVQRARPHARIPDGADIVGVGLLGIQTGIVGAGVELVISGRVAVLGEVGIDVPIVQDAIVDAEGR